jgi:hypothetical protein
MVSPTFLAAANGRAADTIVEWKSNCDVATCFGRPERMTVDAVDAQT